MISKNFLIITSKNSILTYLIQMRLQMKAFKKRMLQCYMLLLVKSNVIRLLANGKVEFESQFYPEQECDETKRDNDTQGFTCFEKLLEINKIYNKGSEKEISKKIGYLRRYFKLYLVSCSEIEKFVKLNPYKFKLKDVSEYLEVRGPLEIKNYQEVKGKLVDLIKKYCL